MFYKISSVINSIYSEQQLFTSLSKINLKIQNIYIKPILNSLNTDVYASKLLIKVKM